MKRLFQGVENKAGMGCPAHPPADDAAGIGVDDKGGIDEAGPSGHVGKVRDPQPIRCPLPDAALAVLEQARPLRDKSGLAFPSPRPGRPLSDMALTKVLRTTGLAGRATVHGFRSSFRDWCADTGKRREIAEAALAHTVGGVEGAYFRSDPFERRRRLMADWAAYLGGADAKVVKLRG